MDTKFKFEELKVWQLAMELGENIFHLSLNYPKEEIYGLISQTRRAADSVALNISEGAIGQSNPEFKKFIGYAIRSLAEVITCLYKAKNREYISDEAFKEQYDFTYKLMNMLVALKRKII